MVGQTIDGHTVEADLGSGSYGDVYRVRHLASGETIALKVSKSTLDASDRLRFEQENAILHQLRVHPRVLEPKSNIVTIPPDLTYYTMELADLDLNAYVSTNYTLTFQEKILLFRDICEGLKHAHSRGVVHRDLHWGNILLRLLPNPQIKLCDFGKAKDFSAQSISSTLPCWGEFVKPPEIVFQTVDTPTLADYISGDMYALGILLYFLLAGRPAIQIGDIRTRIEDYLRTIPSLDTLTATVRSSHYENWLKTVPPPSNYLKVQLRDQVQTDQINSLMKGLCNIDIKERFGGVEQLEQQLTLLHI